MSYTEFYMQTTGDNLNSGSSNADAAALSYTGCNWVQSTRVFTRPSGSFITDGVVVGDWVSIYPDASTSTPYVAQVAAVDALTVTTSASKKMGTAPTDGTGTRNMKVRGAWASPVIFGNMGIAMDLRDVTTSAIARINIKAGSYPRVASALSSLGGFSSSANTVIEGYTTTPGDGGYATIQGPASGASIIIMTVSSYIELRNLIFDGNGTTGSANGVNLANLNTTAIRCVFRNMRGAGVQVGSTESQLISCEAFNNNTSNTSGLSGFRVTASAVLLINCVGAANLRSNFGITGGATTLIRCVAVDAKATGGDGFHLSGGAGTLFMADCTAVGNAGTGINFSMDMRDINVVNCLFASNGSGVGITTSGLTRLSGRFINNAFYGQATEIGSAASFPGIQGSISLASDPFTGQTPANGQFTPSAVAAGVGYGAFIHPSLATTSTASTPDVGAVSAPTPSSGGLMLPIPSTGGYDRC